MKTLALKAIEQAKAALAGTGKANDIKIKVGSYTNDFGSWSSPSVAAASILDDAITAICALHYAAKPTAESSAEFDSAIELIEAFQATI